ncbi:hypothetical protein [Kitasatospora sp. NPDC093806]|uniref:hypothetical protein n=1 Tax=Kitasatospora sp. NPDC093806 TaxID=3155075 RepID=UPI003432C29F
MPVEDAPQDPEALPPAYRAVSTGVWDYVTIDFGDGAVTSNVPIPGQRNAPDDAAEPAEGAAAAADAKDGADGPPVAPPEGKKKARGRKARAAKAAEAARAAADAAAKPAKAGAPAGRRRPAPLLLLAAAVLIGGTVTGQLIAMLVGWALAYLSRHLTDFTRKLAVFGIPMMTITGSSLWFWGRAQGRWGTGLQPGEQATQAVWNAAPGVLRVAAVLSAVFLLGMSLRRRPAPPPEPGQ